jgi:hypothetical protein
LPVSSSAFSPSTPVNRIYGKPFFQRRKNCSPTGMVCRGAVNQDEWGTFPTSPSGNRRPVSRCYSKRLSVPPGRGRIPSSLLLKPQFSGNGMNLGPLHYGMDVCLPNTKQWGDELQDLFNGVGFYNEVEVVSRSVKVSFDQANARRLSIFLKPTLEFLISSYGSGWTVLSDVFMIKYKQHISTIPASRSGSLPCRSLPISNPNSPVRMSCDLRRVCRLDVATVTKKEEGSLQP